MPLLVAGVGAFEVVIAGVLWSAGSPSIPWLVTGLLGIALAASVWAVRSLDWPLQVLLTWLVLSVTLGLGFVTMDGPSATAIAGSAWFGALWTAALLGPVAVLNQLFASGSKRNRRSSRPNDHD